MGVAISAGPLWFCYYFRNKFFSWKKQDSIFIETTNKCAAFNHIFRSTDLLIKCFQESCFQESWILHLLLFCSWFFGFSIKMNGYFFVNFDSQTKICFEEIKTSSKFVENNSRFVKQDLWMKILMSRTKQNIYSRNKLKKNSVPKIVPIE